MSIRSSITMVHLLLAVVLLFAMACVPGSLQAQGTSATVSGVVTDPTGAKVPGASVTFTNAATGAVEKATTNAEGLYRINGLAPGSYNAAVTMPGFKTAIQQSIDLHLEDQVSLNYALELGGTSESVTVNAAAEILESVSPTVSQVIEGRQVEDTPLNGRNSMALVALTPGVVPQGATSGAASNNTNGGSFTNAFGFNNYQIAGGFANQSSVYVDGTPINVVEGHPTAYVVTQDAVQEFRVESSVVNPRYGEFGGGVISFGTKSGTNQLHGSFYEYFRNNVFNANTFFNKQSNVPRPEFTQNQYGATAGGPIKRDRAFFFFSYEGFRLAQGVPNAGRVPTTAELSGDFRADAPVFDPLTPGKQIQCNGVLNVICQPGQAGAGTSSTIDPTANYIGNTLRYFPTPNTTTGGVGVNFTQNAKAAASNNEYLGRVDYKLGSKQTIFARYTRYQRFQQGTVYLTNTGGPTSGSSVAAAVNDAVLGDTIVLSPTSTLDLRASYLRYSNLVLPGDTNVNLAAFGTNYAAIAPQLSDRVYPNISITNNITQPYAQAVTTTAANLNNYVFAGSYSKILGRHSLTIGGEARQREEYFSLLPDPAGLFVFAGTNTACLTPTCTAPATATSPAGPVQRVTPGGGATPIADFLLGAITAAPLGFQTATPTSTVNHYGGVFANDTWQATPKLSVTAGVRYEIPGGFTEKKDRNAVLLPQLANPLVLVNTSAYPSRSDLSTHNLLFSPRVGFSFAPYAGTTVRAGYSLAFLPMDTVYNTGPSGSSINNPTTLVSPTNYALPAAIRSTLSNPVPASSPKGPDTLLEPIGRGYATNPNYFFGEPIQGRISNSAFPLLQQYNFNVQQAFGGSSVMQLAYLGARGEHLPVYGTIGIDQLPDRYDGLSTAAISALATAAGSAPGAATVGAYSLRPYSSFQNVSAISPYYGDSYYNSLQATLTKRFNGGGTILSNFSWTKNLSNSESSNAQVEQHATGVIQDYDNLRGEKSYLSFDVPYRLVVSYILDLPVGNGKRFLGNSTGVVGRLVSGFNVSGINTFQDGLPEAIIATNNSLATVYGGGTIRPNVVPGVAKRFQGSVSSRAKAGLPVINAAAFAAPSATSFGNEPRTDGQVRTQGVDNWDFSLGKTTAINEHVSIVFRAEAFNVINHTQFGDPNLTNSSAQFGIITTQANSPRLLQFSLRANY